MRLQCRVLSESRRWLLVVVLLFQAPCLLAEDSHRHTTLFQTNHSWTPSIDIQTDLAVVYGGHGDLDQRFKSFREAGYRLGFMTGISWGRYDDYYLTDAGLKVDEIQTRKNGELFMHGNSKTVGYNVPSPDYVAYIKEVVRPAIREGVEAIFLEEPEFWAEAGWSRAFQEEWKRFYGEDWVAPDSSADAQYRASLLKYRLYQDALREVFQFIKETAAEKGLDIKCYVPTHSMLNYAHWRIVSPEASLAHIPECDGYIAQAWTGTSRTPNLYRGLRKERTFETAYFEYGQMLAMVRPTGRQVWFLHDPVEDDPRHTWEDYEKNYEASVVASLLWPEVSAFQVMPWPHRIFEGKYADAEGNLSVMPEAYRSKLTTVVQVLGDMNQPVVRRDSGTEGIGVLVSDTMMFQRANPYPSDPDLSSFYGLALPLLKHGIPAGIVQMETLLTPGVLDDFKVLFLTYEGQKPLDPAYHDVLEAWIRKGGALIYVGDGTDRYHHVAAWWNEQGETRAKAQDGLFERLGVENQAYNEAMAVDQGWIRILAEKPRQIARYDLGAAKIIEVLGQVLERMAIPLKTQSHILLQRGPYVVAAVFDESVSDNALHLSGPFVDLFDADLPVLEALTLQPGERALLYDLRYAPAQAPEVQVIAGAARMHAEALEPGVWRLKTRGPANVEARARLRLPAPPTAVTFEETIPGSHSWDPESETLFLSWPNAGAEVVLQVAFDPALQ